MMRNMFGLLALLASGAVATFDLPWPNPMPTNDIALFHRALYQDCLDGNNDSLAYDFLEGPQKLLLSNKLTRDLLRTVYGAFSDQNSVFFSARTNYIDSKIASWIAADPSIRQVVIVASGFDSRPYRLVAPQVDFFELDKPDVVARKQERVRKHGLKCTGKSVSYVGADLRHTTVQATLQRTSSYDPARKTIFVVEGLAYYLDQASLDKLFESLGRLAAQGSRIVFDFTNRCLIDANCKNLNPLYMAVFLEMMKLGLNEPYLSGVVPGELKSWLARYGWAQREVAPFSDAREPPLSVESWQSSTMRPSPIALFAEFNFATAERAGAMGLDCLVLPGGGGDNSCS